MASIPACCRIRRCRYFQNLALPPRIGSKRFNGVTLALLRLDVPEGRALPFAPGQAFAPSKARLPSGEFLSQRFIRACAGGPEFARPLPAARKGWLSPLVRFLDCLSSSSHDQVLGMLASAVEATCRAVDAAASDAEAAKHPKRIWRRLQGLVSLITPRHGREPIRSATNIRPAHLG